MRYGLVILCVVTVGCGDPPLLDLHIVTPAGEDPLTGVDNVRLVVTDPYEDRSYAVTDTGSLDLELELEVHGEVGSVVLEGRKAGQLVARGETPPLSFRPLEEQLELLVARSGALSRLKPSLEGAASEMTTVLVPATGILMAGGADPAGIAQQTASVYDFYQHQLLKLPALPTPRVGAAGAFCGAWCALLVGGTDGTALATKMLWYDGTRWTEVDDGLSPAERRSGAGIALLADGSYLVLGGEGGAGPLASVLVLEPGIGGASPALKPLSARMTAARDRPSVAVSNGEAVLVTGGHADGVAAAELFYRTTGSFQALSLPGPAPRSGAAAVGMEGGKLAIIGGRGAGGGLLADAWIVDTATLKVSHRPNTLKQGRADHRALLLGSQIVVVGGSLESGLADQLELLSAKDLSHVSQTPLGEPRIGFGVAHMGQGSLLIGGGLTGAGKLADSLEVYQTALPYVSAP